MNSGDGHVVPLCLLSGSNYHFMGNGIGKQDQKIRTADLFSHRSVLLREYLGLAAITFTDISILTNHSFISTDNYYAHRFLLTIS